MPGSCGGGGRGGGDGGRGGQAERGGDDAEATQVHRAVLSRGVRSRHCDLTPTSAHDPRAGCTRRREPQAGVEAAPATSRRYSTARLVAIGEPPGIRHQHPAGPRHEPVGQHHQGPGEHRRPAEQHGRPTEGVPQVEGVRPAEGQHHRRGEQRQPAQPVTRRALQGDDHTDHRQGTEVQGPDDAEDEVRRLPPGVRQRAVPVGLGGGPPGGEGGVDHHDEQHRRCRRRPGPRSTGAHRHGFALDHLVVDRHPARPPGAATRSGRRG